jgi:hypothetical protein
MHWERTKEGGGDNWMNEIKQKLETLGMGDIWENGRNNGKNMDKNKQTIDTLIWNGKLWKLR